MKKKNKAIRFLGSMQFAMILLAVLIAACILGSVIEQGQTFALYSEVYGERAAAAIVALHLDDVFHSPWFILITAFLCANLLMCNLTRLPALVRRWKNSADRHEETVRNPDAVAVIDEDPQKLFADLRFGGIKKGITEDGPEYLYGSRGRAGIWGAWVCHLGVLILIVGFALGQGQSEEYTVYGVEGQTKQVGDTDYLLTIDDFRIDLREDDTVEQYTADLTVRNAATGESFSGSASVNNPISGFGMKFYQNSTGWAASVIVEKNGEELQREILCAGEFISVTDKPDLVIYLNAFYPDYAMVEGEPVTLSSKLNNPAYLYRVYYQGNMIGMNALTGDDVITIDEYTVRFEDPQSYTLIQIKKDRFAGLALAGGIITLLGIVLALFVQPAAAAAIRQQDGSWKVYASGKKGGLLFVEDFEKAASAYLVRGSAEEQGKENSEHGE